MAAKVTLRPPLALPDPPSLRGRASVRVRHPGYPQGPNLLLSFPSTDSSVTASGEAVHGVHFHFVHTASAIVANNRFDGWLSSDVQGQDRLDRLHDELLEGGDYFFHVPEPNASTAAALENATLEDATLENATLSPAAVPPAVSCYPIVPNFRTWRFPSNIPPAFRAAIGVHNYTASTGGSLAVRIRDVQCLVSAAPEPVEVAHLLPTSEADWFAQNEMLQYEPGIAQNRRAIDSAYNAILLRQDIHTLYDRSMFSIVPKYDAAGARWVPAVHVKDPAAGWLCELYHNRQLRTLQGITPEYLFARFAWDIFPQVLPFLNAKTERKLAVVHNGQTQRIANFSADECVRYGDGQGPGRSNPGSNKRTKSAGPEAADDDGEHDDSPAASHDSALSGLPLRKRRRPSSGTNSDADADEEELLQKYPFHVAEEIIDNRAYRQVHEQQLRGRTRYR